MISGLYNAASSMITRQVQQENLSNNISNLNTPGYKKTSVSLKTFEDTLVSCREKYVGTPVRNKVIGKLNFGVGIDGTKTDYSQGILQTTDRNLDFAIADERYVFNVMDDKGNIKTSRDGRFQILSNGYLVNSTGDRVLGSNGQPIVINSNKLEMNANGVITNSNGRVSFGLSEIDTETGAVIRNTGDASTVKQGQLERSNVKVEDVMVDMITVQRNYESSQRVFKQIDETIGKAVNEVGTLR